MFQGQSLAQWHPLRMLYSQNPQASQLPVWRRQGVPGWKSDLLLA